MPACETQATPYINEAHFINDAGVLFQVWPATWTHGPRSAAEQGCFGIVNSSYGCGHIASGYSAQDQNHFKFASNRSELQDCKAMLPSDSKKSTQVEPEMSGRKGLLLAQKLWSEVLATLV